MPHDLQIYTHEFSPKRGGIATYCHELANAAAHLLEQVAVIAPAGALVPDGIAPSYRLEHANNRGSHNPGCIWNTSQLLRKNLHQRPQAIHLLAEPGPILAYGILSERHRSAAHVRITIHGSEIERWRSNPIKNALARRALRSANAIHAVSTPVLESLLRHFPEAQGKAKVVANALPESFRRVPERPQRQASDPTISNAPSIMQLLSVGRIHPRKGFDQVIQALALLSDEERSELQYTIAGAAKDQAYLSRLKQLAETARIQMNVSLNPNSDQLNQCYAAADLFALTSMPRKRSVEGFGIVYLEAGAYALPCLAYDTGGVSEAIQNGITGVLVETGDVKKLSEEIRFFMKTPKARRQMGEANRSFALARTWQDVVRETI